MTCLAFPCTFLDLPFLLLQVALALDLTTDLSMEAYDDWAEVPTLSSRKIYPVVPKGQERQQQLPAPAEANKPKNQNYVAAFGEMDLCGALTERLSLSNYQEKLRAIATDADPASVLDDIARQTDDFLEQGYHPTWYTAASTLAAVGAQHGPEKEADARANAVTRANRVWTGLFNATLPALRSQEHLTAEGRNGGRVGQEPRRIKRGGPKLASHDETFEEEGEAPHLSVSPVNAAIALPDNPVGRPLAFRPTLLMCI